MKPEEHKSDCSRIDRSEDQSEITQFNLGSAEMSQASLGSLRGERPENLKSNTIQLKLVSKRRIRVPKTLNELPYEMRSSSYTYSLVMLGDMLLQLDLVTSNTEFTVTKD